MDLKAVILLTVCLAGLSDAMGKVKQSPKKQNEKSEHLPEHQQPKEKLQQLIKKTNRQDQLGSPTIIKENKMPFGKQQLPLPLVLSPEKIHNMDFSPAMTIALPPKELNVPGHDKISEVSRRQVQYDAAIAALLEEALKTAAVAQPGSSETDHAVPLEPAPIAYHGARFVQPVAYHEAPATQPLALVQSPAPFAQINEQAEGIAEPVHQPILYKKQRFPIHHGDHDELQDYAAKYKFGYRVVDTHTGNDFGQTESRDGGLTTGHYHVLLPDGRTQTVQYWSDLTGYHAHISYDQHAIHI